MSEDARKVALIGAGSKLISAVADQLLAGGGDVIRFPDVAAFAASETARETAALYVPGQFRIGATTLAAAPALRAVISPFTGIEGFDLDAATQATVVVGNAPTTESVESMAEATLMLILACLYDLPGKIARVADGWGGGGPAPGRMLKGKRVGLIGYGRISRALADRLTCFGAITQAYTRQGAAKVAPATRFVGLDELLSTSDIVCVLTTLNDESRGMLDARRLALCKRDAILVNVARGGLVDEDALCALAARGHFAKIAFDVFAAEPLPVDSPLRSLPNAILTPHMIGHTSETVESLVRAGVESIGRVLRGEPPLFPCNPEVLPAWSRRWSQGELT